MKRTALITGAAGGLGHPRRSRDYRQRSRARGGGASVPLARLGSPDELADLMAWLLSDQAARVTGQVWAMDAGFSTIRPLVK